MDDRDLFDLHRQANELRVRLAYLEAAIRRMEHDRWRQFQNEREAHIREMDAAGKHADAYPGF